MLDLVTDRTEADVAAWKAGGTDTKGEYKYTDLNRVGAALHTLSEALADCGIDAPVTARTDWERASIYTLPDLNAYLDDVRRIREALDMSPETPAVPETARKLTWDKANNIEQILLDVENTISRLKLSWFYSGEIYCGEV